MPNETQRGGKPAPGRPAVSRTRRSAAPQVRRCDRDHADVLDQRRHHERQRDQDQVGEPGRREQEPRDLGVRHRGVAGARDQRPHDPARPSAPSRTTAALNATSKTTAA